MTMGTPAEQEQIESIARAAVGRHPQSGRILDGVLARFSRSTAPDRHRAAGAGSGRPAPGAPRRWVAVVGAVSVSMVLLAALTAGAALLPGHGKGGSYSDIPRDAEMAVSAVAAAVAVVFAALGCLIPAWGGPETRAQSWKTHLAAATALGIGLVWSVFQTGDDRAAVGRTWSVWLAANAVALAAALAAALLLRRRVTPAPVRPRGAEPPQCQT